MPDPKSEVIAHMFNELANLGRGITIWEEEFIADMQDRWERLGDLSDGQYEKLKQIYEDRVG